MSDKLPTPASPFVIERLMRDTRRSYDDEDFTSEDEFREKMHAYVEKGDLDNRLEGLKEHPQELAQELAFQAFESANQSVADELTKKALTIDPDCVDALTIRAFLDSENASDLIDAIEHAATCGETRLGEDFFS